MNITKNTEILSITLCSSSQRDILCKKLSRQTTREISHDMTRVKSSNVWSYAIKVKDDKGTIGDVYAQFKDTKGRPGDVYVYYDVPTVLYRRWLSAPSKGHFFWKYIRNNFIYAKLTGDKKTKLRNGV